MSQTPSAKPGAIRRLRRRVRRPGRHRKKPRACNNRGPAFGPRHDR